MKKHTWDWLLILQVLLILWALLFFSSLFLPGSGRFSGFLAWGNPAGLFLSIPLSIVSLMGRAKGRFSQKASVAVIPLSVLTFLAGAVTWAFFIAVMRMLSISAP